MDRQSLVTRKIFEAREVEGARPRGLGGGISPNLTSTSNYYVLLAPPVMCTHIASSSRTCCRTGSGQAVVKSVVFHAFGFVKITNVTGVPLGGYAFGPRL